MSVYRIYVEKKEPFAVEAAGVLASLRNDLGLSKLRHVRLLNRYENSPEDLRRAGIEYAAEQALDLARHGVDGIHIYTMNQPDIAAACVQKLVGAGYGRS